MQAWNALATSYPRLHGPQEECSLNAVYLQVQILGSSYSRFHGPQEECSLNAVYLQLLVCSGILD